MAITHAFVSGKADGGDSSLVQPSNWNAAHNIDNATVTRAMLEGTAVNWQFLGKASLGANAATVGPVVLSTVRKHLQIRFWTPGYANSGIASLQLGGAAVDTGSNYCASLIEGVTLNTTSVSVTGIRIGVSTTTGPRYCVLDVDTWASNLAKRVLGRTNSVSTAANTAPTFTQVAGLWVNTVDSIQRVQFTAFNALTGTTTVNLLSGTEFEVWGRDDD
jgi:hypothetical protein